MPSERRTSINGIKHHTSHIVYPCVAEIMTDLHLDPRKSQSHILIAIFGWMREIPQPHEGVENDDVLLLVSFCLSLSVITFSFLWVLQKQDQSMPRFCQPSPGLSQGRCLARIVCVSLRSSSAFPLKKGDSYGRSTSNLALQLAKETAALHCEKIMAHSPQNRIKLYDLSSCDPFIRSSTFLHMNQIAVVVGQRRLQPTSPVSLLAPDAASKCDLVKVNIGRLSNFNAHRLFRMFQIPTKISCFIARLSNSLLIQTSITEVSIWEQCCCSITDHTPWDFGWLVFQSWKIDNPSVNQTDIIAIVWYWREQGIIIKAENGLWNRWHVMKLSKEAKSTKSQFFAQHTVAQISQIVEVLLICFQITMGLLRAFRGPIQAGKEVQNSENSTQIWDHTGSPSPILLIRLRGLQG